MACHCGHAEEEHGDDPEYPGSSACNAQDSDGDDCGCIAFEENEDEEEDEE